MLRPLRFSSCPILIITMVQTKLRRDEPSPIPQHTSTATPTISNVVSVPDSAPTVPLADNVHSVVSIAIEVSFVEFLVQWLLAVSFSTGILFIWYILH
ncbi:hypothetical protein BCON_0011g00390 [Botryotinia convoluta]|uniref:Uncharacterized protein n=1 Tax=Botryotinia convoluta TaxID=54673 RepID=A0A4Z1IQG7_9HELO|nr:hypothetical protein BCON_0011g00390 [Botryotinia convoluta]